jgi:alpha-mannosidase
MAPGACLTGREIVADGPLQFRIRSEYALGGSSKVTQDIVLHASSPRIDFETVIHWAEKRQLLKAGFDLNVFAETARHEIQYGHVERPTHRNLPGDRARFEVCCHKWMDLSDAGFGVALLNESKYGVSVHGGKVGLSLIKSSTHPDDRGDAGQHVITYSLVPHAGGFSVPAVIRPAYELNVPLCVYQGGPGMTDVEAPISVEGDTVIVEALKWAEAGKAFVVRLYEAGRASCNATVRVRVPVRSVSATNMLEEEPEVLTLRDGAVSFALRPFEIKTLRFEL